MSDHEGAPDVKDIMRMRLAPGSEGMPDVKDIMRARRQAPRRIASVVRVPLPCSLIGNRVQGDLQCNHPAKPCGPVACSRLGCGVSCAGYLPEDAIDLPPGGWKRNLLFHMHSAPGAWQWHAEQIRRRLPLFTGRRIIAVTTGGGLDDPAKIREALPGCEVLEVPNNPTLREVATFEPLFGLLAGTDGVTLYAQSKGATRKPPETGRRWAEVLYETCCDYWPWVEQVLRWHPLAGTFLKIGTGWKAEQSRSDWHYSGSWFWFRNADLYAKEWRKIDQFNHGIEPYPSLHFGDHEAGCLFYRGDVAKLNLYDWSFWAKTVEPELTTWQRNHLFQRTAVSV